MVAGGCSPDSIDGMPIEDVLGWHLVMTAYNKEVAAQESSQRERRR
jgi:hypothetical protein